MRRSWPKTFLNSGSSFPVLSAGAGRGFKTVRKSFFGGVSGLILPLVGDGLAPVEGGGEALSVGSFLLRESLLSCELTLSARDLGVMPEEKPAGRPPILNGFATPPGGGDLIKPPILTSCLGPLVGLRPKSTLPLCFALLISDIHAGCWDGRTGLGFGDSGLFRALSSQLDFVGLHLFESIAFDGLLGGVVSMRKGCSAKVSSWLALGVCDREAGSGGLTNPSLDVEAVIVLLMELAVPGRPSWVIVALL